MNDGISTNNDEVNFLLTFVKNMEVMEIGTFKGNTTQKLAEQNELVYSIDPYIKNYDDNDPASSFDLLEAKKEALKLLNEYNNIYLFHDRSETLAETWKSELDAIFIDGDHSEEGFKKDLVWISKVKDNGIIAFHDYDNPTYPHLKTIIDKEIRNNYKFLGQKGMMIVFKKCMTLETSDTDFIYAELLNNDKKILKRYSKNLNKIVELGTFLGGGTVLFAKNCKNVISIDIFEDIDLIEDETNKNHYKILFDKNPRFYKDIKLKLKNYNNIELIKNLTYLEAKNHDDIDMIFIDADHSYEGVKKDFEAWYPKIKQNGIIAFHDSNPGNGWAGIPKFMEELKGDSRVLFLELRGSVSIFEKVGEE